MGLVKKTLYLSEQNLTFINQVAADRDLNESEALRYIINEYSEVYAQKDKLIAAAVLEAFDEKYKTRYMDPIRIRTGYLDKNVQILLDGVNSLITYTNAPYSSFVETPHWTMHLSSDAIKEKISTYKQMKDNKSK